MSARPALVLGLWAAIAAGLWTAAALALMPLPWPAPPFDPDTMTLDRIRLAFGLMPRGAVALLAGAMLGLSGALLQEVLRNPVADPSVLGISSGAMLALIAATLFAPGLLAAGRWPVACAGAAIAAALVLGLGAAQRFEPVALAVGGMLVSLFASAVATAMTLAQGQYLFSMVVWTGGSLVQTGWGPALGLAAMLAACGLGAAAVLRPLRVLGLGAA
ncbi:iron chelate uptake ABC transporter family permease subunit, partial [Mangrovicoccus algicola]